MGLDHVKMITVVSRSRVEPETCCCIPRYPPRRLTRIMAPLWLTTAILEALTTTARDIARQRQRLETLQQ